MSGNFYARYPVTGGGGGSGTVTSVGLALPVGVFNVAGSPVTTSGTLTGSFVNQSANTVLSGPTSGGAAAPAFRALVASDIPSLPYISTTLGTPNGLGVAGNTLSLGLSTTSTTGALSGTDWNTFNNKQAALTFGNLTDVGTDGISITGGSGSVIGSGTAISQHVSDSTHNGYLSFADWNTFNNKFDLPSLTAGSVLFSNGTTLAQDNANFHWDDAINELRVGPNPVTASSQSILASMNVTDPVADISAPLVTVGDVHYTTNSNKAFFSSWNVLRPLVDSGVTAGSGIIGSANIISRIDPLDTGTIGIGSGYYAQLVSGNAVNSMTLYAAFAAGNHSIDNMGQIGDMYDFWSIPSSIPAGVVTNRYGIYINPDANYTKQNWLSGTAVFGGASYSAPTEVVHVNGDISATKSVSDAVSVAGLLTASTNTTMNGSNNTVGLQTSSTSLVQSGAENDKSVAGTINTVQRGDGTDDGILDGMSGTTNLMFINSGPGGVTNANYGYSSILITQQGTLTDHYDFYSQRAPAGGTLTNHYGVYISADTTTPVKNWLSGNTQIGGSSFTAPTSALVVNGATDQSSNNIINVLDPVNPQDAATKNYVDATPDVNRRYVDFLNGNDAGSGTAISPWKTLQHAYNSISPTINEPYTIYLSGGNNDTDSAITAKPNVSLVSDYNIQITPAFTISGGSTNDGCTFTNITFVGAFSWVRNDATAIGVTFNNCSFFSGPTVQQHGAGTLSVTGVNSVFVNSSFQTANGGFAVFNDCSFLGTTSFEDPGASGFSYIELDGGYSSGTMTVNGFYNPIYITGFVHDVPFGASVTFTNPGSGFAAVEIDSNGLPPTYTGAPSSLTFLEQANYVNGTLAVAKGGTGTTTSTGTGSVVLSSAPTMANPVVGTQSQGDNSTKAASTAYVDVAIANAVAGVNPAVAVQAATTSAGNTSGLTYNNGVGGIGATLTGPVNTALTVDGYTFTALGQRLLVKNDTQSPSGAFNGVYYVTQIQTALLPIILTRALDYDTPSDINNTGAIPVINGTVNGTTQWVLTSLVNTVGTDPLTFTQFAKNPADYLLKTNNLSDIASASTAFKNIAPLTTAGDIIYENNTPAPARLAIGSSGDVLTVVGGLPAWQAPSGGAATIKKLVITEVQSNGTHGGSTTASTWLPRNLNTLMDPQAVVTNSASFTGSGGTNNDITLPAGTYWIDANSPYYSVGAFMTTRLYDTTNSAVLLNGLSAIQPYNGNFLAKCTGIFTLAGTTTMQLQYYAGQSISTTGLGIANNTGVTPEVYTAITIEKIA